MQKEIWKDIPNYEGYYKVSNLGNIKSVDRLFYMKQNKSIGRKKGRVIKQRFTSNGYLGVSLHKNSNRKTITTHQLVAMAFLGHTPNGYKTVVDHINRDKSDNRVENLRIITQRENSLRRLHKKNKHSCIYFLEKRNEYVLRISINGNQKTCGYFKSLAMAIIRRNEIKSNNYKI